jgi:DNA-binding LacI/PurR family transcriptional regulator
VWRAVEELGYEPDLAARALAKRRSDLVDLVVIDDAATTFGTNPYYSRVVVGVLEALSNTGARMRVHVVDLPEAPAKLDDVARTTGLGGLLVNVPAVLAERFRARNERVISLGLSAPGVPHIEPQNAQGTREAIHHLYRTGRRRIGAVHGPHWNSCARGRRRGFLAAAEELGIEPVGVDGDFCRESGIAATRRLLAAHPDLDAIFAACDLAATGVLQVLSETGRRVPDDVALVGFDDSVLAACATPAMTSVRQPVEYIAATATRALLDGYARPGWERIVPTSLAVRRSTAA